jgi:hypothetical protein
VLIVFWGFQDFVAELEAVSGYFCWAFACFCSVLFKHFRLMGITSQLLVYFDFIFFSVAPFGITLVQADACCGFDCGRLNAA